jgi:hypothetical protein
MRSVPGFKEDHDVSRRMVNEGIRKSKQPRSPFKFPGIPDDHDPQDILNGLFGLLLVHGIPLQASSFRSEMASVFGKVITIIVWV